MKEHENVIKTVSTYQSSEQKWSSGDQMDIKPFNILCMLRRRVTYK